MSCASSVSCSMYADGALSGAEASAIERHLRDCSSCRALVEALAREGRQLRAALRRADEPRTVPRFEEPLGLRHVLIGGAGVTAIAALAGSVWQAAASAVPAGLHWINPLDAGFLLDLSISSVVYLLRGGAPMVAVAMDFAGIAVLITVLAIMAYALTRSVPGRGAGALLTVPLLAMALPWPADAVEIRRGEPLVTVAADETIDDTLVVFGQNLAVDGTINGDLVAFARRIVVRGTVTGDVIGAAEIVTIDGTVGGNVIGFGRSVELTRARVARNLYGFGRDVSVGSSAEIAGNAMTFGADVTVGGRVGIDLVSFARTLEVSGLVERDVEASGQSVTVLPGARIGGSLLARLPRTDELHTAAGAVIDGDVDVRVAAERERRSRYLTVSFYLRQVLWTGAAFVVGLLLLWLVPPLRSVPLGSGEQLLKAGGLGLATAVVLPFVSVLALITIIGIPLGLAGFFTWALALYFGKIVVAQQIGRALFSSPHGLPHYAATLIAGLVIVMIAVNLPFVGWLANVVLTLLGVGVIALCLMDLTRRRERTSSP